MRIAKRSEVNALRDALITDLTTLTEALKTCQTSAQFERVLDSRVPMHVDERLADLVTALEIGEQKGFDDGNS